jgi:molybdate transport system substrate-binding protein
VRDGEAFDFVVLAGDAIARLATEGHVDANSRVDLARSGMAIAIAAGAPRPDVGSESAVRDAVLRARGIAYSTGPSGAHLLALLERWGIGATVVSRLVQAPPGTPVATLLARGDAELGFQQLSEFQHAAGIDIAGPPSTGYSADDHVRRRPMPRLEASRRHSAPAILSRLPRRRPRQAATRHGAGHR